MNLHLTKGVRTICLTLSLCAIFYWILLTLSFGRISFAWVFLTGGIFLFLFTLLDSLWLPYWHKIRKLPRKLILSCIACGFLIFTAVEIRIFYIGSTSSKTYGDTILVLGAGLHKGDQISASLQYRLDKAIELHKEKPDTYIVVSGGQGKDELLSEAAAMKAYLIQQGVPETIILMEDTSTTTSENMRFSKEVMRKHGIPSNHISLITNDFHMQRAILYAQMYDFEVERHPSDGLWMTQLCFYVREFFGVARLWLFQY